MCVMGKYKLFMTALPGMGIAWHGPRTTTMFQVKSNQVYSSRVKFEIFPHQEKEKVKYVKGTSCG